ncbi:hypothetical protein HDU76_003638 [Blyttiomyces sp. JEL0837]|nr:hypothetical protein HDU76_003638 [Blyttiomyces sp. JEL0837]
MSTNHTPYFLDKTSPESTISHFNEPPNTDNLVQQSLPHSLRYQNYFHQHPQRSPSFSSTNGAIDAFACKLDPGGTSGGPSYLGSNTLTPNDFTPRNVHVAYNIKQCQSGYNIKQCQSGSEVNTHGVFTPEQAAAAAAILGFTQSSSRTNSTFKDAGIISATEQPQSKSLGDHAFITTSSSSASGFSSSRKRAADGTPIPLAVDSQHSQIAVNTAAITNPPSSNNFEERLHGVHFSRCHSAPMSNVGLDHRVQHLVAQHENGSAVDELLQAGGSQSVGSGIANIGQQQQLQQQHQRQTHVRSSSSSNNASKTSKTVFVSKAGSTGGHSQQTASSSKTPVLVPMPGYETLEKGQHNSFFVLFIQNVLDITRIPLPVVTLAIKYVQRLRRLRGSLPAAPGEETRVFSVSLILAQKYSDDTPYGNRMWGHILGLPPLELSKLETRFLEAIGYDLYLTEKEYASFCRGVQALAREWNKWLVEATQKAAKAKAAAANVAKPMVAGNAVIIPLVPAQMQGSRRGSVNGLATVNTVTSAPVQPLQAPSGASAGIDSISRLSRIPPPTFTLTHSLVSPITPSSVQGPQFQNIQSQMTATPNLASSSSTSSASSSATTTIHPFLQLPVTLLSSTQSSPLPPNDGMLPSTLDAYLAISARTYGLTLTPCGVSDRLVGSPVDAGVGGGTGTGAKLTPSTQSLQMFINCSGSGSRSMSNAGSSASSSMAGSPVKMDDETIAAIASMVSPSRSLEMNSPEKATVPSFNHSLLPAINSVNQSQFQRCQSDPVTALSSSTSKATDRVGVVGLQVQPSFILPPPPKTFELSGSVSASPDKAGTGLVEGSSSRTMSFEYDQSQEFTSFNESGGGSLEESPGKRMRKM